MGAAPRGPGDDGGGLDPALRQALGNPADFLHRPADQWRLLGIIARRLFGGAAVLAFRRMAASIAKGSMKSETCRGPPCPERGSVWARPNPVFARFEAASVGPRPPSAPTHPPNRGPA